MKFKFIGGNICLDFINTAGDHLSAEPSEYLKNYEDLITWGVAAEIIKPSKEKSFLEVGQLNPAKAKRILKKAINVREVLFEMLSATAFKKSSAPSLIKDFNTYLAEAFKHLEIQNAKNAKLSWTWSGGENNPEQLIWIVTWAAANLFIEEDLNHLKICADNLCGWLFLDTSKNKRRAWCDMKDCGNRNKFRRYYSRNKSS